MVRLLPAALAIIALTVCAGLAAPAGAQPAAKAKAKPDDDDDNKVVFDGRGIDYGSIPFKLGNAARGKAIYDAQNCAACHRIADKGSRVAPDLSDIGAIREPGRILTSLTDPAKGVMAINRPITIVTNDGRTFQGRRLNEDTFTVQMIDRQENIHSILKSDIRRYDVAMVSDMPSLKGKLSDAAMADLLAYLVSLKGH